MGGAQRNTAAPPPWEDPQGGGLSLPCRSPHGLMAPPPLERLQDAAHPEASTLGGDQPSLRVSWTDLGVEWVGGAFWASSWVST